MACPGFPPTVGGVMVRPVVVATVALASWQTGHSELSTGATNLVADRPPRNRAKRTRHGRWSLAADQGTHGFPGVGWLWGC